MFLIYLGFIGVWVSGFGLWLVLSFFVNFIFFRGVVFVYYFIFSGFFFLVFGVGFFFVVFSEVLMLWVCRSFFVVGFVVFVVIRDSGGGGAEEGVVFFSFVV